MTHIVELLQHLLKKLGLLIGTKCVQNQQMTNFAKKIEQYLNKKLVF